MAYRTEYIGFNGNNYLPLAGGTMTGSILATPDNTIDLGSLSSRWRAIYGYTVDLASGINGRADLTITSTARSSAAQTGYSWTWTGGAGGAADAGAAGGNGGPIAIVAGRGGAGTGARAGGAGAALDLDAGLAGADGGAGTGIAGGVTLGITNASSVTIGRAAITTTINGTLRYDRLQLTAANGAVFSLPAQAAGFLIVNVAGTDRTVPYYNV